jgi:hypothetical protein
MSNKDNTLKGKLICRRLPENVYDITFFTPQGDSFAHQRVIDKEYKLSGFFDNPYVYIMNQYRAKILNPMVPTVFIEDNILVTDNVEYTINIVVYNSSPKREQLCISDSELVAHNANLGFYTSRLQTIELIHKYLNDNVMVLIRAPPFCGKTIFLKLYREYLIGKGITAYYIDCSRIGQNKDFNTFLNTQLGRKWDEAMEEENAYFLLDEAQFIFDIGEDLWRYCKSIDNMKINTPYKKLPKLLVISNYADRPNTGRITPIVFNIAINYQELALKDREYEELLQSYERFVFQPKISHKISEFIKSLTSGHIGLVHNTFKYLINRFSKGQPEDSDIFKYLISTNFLTSFSSCRVLPPELKKYFEQPYINVIDELNSSPENQIAPPGYQIYADSTEEMIKLGILAYYHVTSMGHSMKISFASPLIKNLFIHQYSFAKIMQDPTRVWTQDQLGQFLIEVLKRFSPTSLQTCLSHGCKNTLLEYVWQKEFYRCAFSLLPSSRYSLSPEIGYAFDINGRIDFYINNDLKWAVELVKDSDKLISHLERFKSGSYYNMIDKISEWIILDFRKTIPKIVEEKVWYIIYNSDYTIFTVMVSGCQDYIINLD